MDLNETEKIQQNITYFANRDMESFSFYDNINQFQFDTNELYDFFENPDDLVNISDEQPFPPIIRSSITPFTERIYFGIIPMLSRFYCIIDNSVYFWPLNSIDDNSVSYYIEEESSFISCVNCGHVNPKVFKEKCIGVILYGTDTSMKIVPVTDNNIYFELSIEIKLKFIPTEFYTSKSGTIFVSSNEGDIYSVILSINEVTGKVESKIKNLTRNKFLQLFPPILLLRSQIIQIAVDEETQILAALNKKSIIKFYKIAEDKMELVFEFNPRDFEYLQQFYIRYISTVPLNSKNSTKFVAFLHDGTRVYFSVDPFIDTVTMSTMRYPPPLENPDTFFTAFLYPSYCIFLYFRSIVITFESHKPNELNLIPLESYCVIPFQCDILSYSQNIPNIQPTKMANNSFFWQHLFLPNPGYLITNKGIRTLNFIIPIDSLLKIFKEEENDKVSMSQTLRNWAKFDVIETTTTALLLAGKMPNQKYQCFNFIMKTAQEYEASRKELDNHFFANFTFCVRLMRILSLVWMFPLFYEKEENVFEINTSFKNPPLNYIKEIKLLKSLCDDYYKFLIKSNQQKMLDGDIFPFISSYLTNIIGILRFVKIIAQLEGDVINKVFEILDLKHRNRLISMEFGYNSQFQNTNLNQNFHFVPFNTPPKLEESFHAFSMKLYEVMPESNALKKMEKKCPQFYDHLDIEVLNATKVIKEKVDDSDGEITNSVKTLIRCISRPMDLDEICLLLKEKGCFESAYKLCIAKADNVDPLRLAISWYHSDEKNNIGQDEFDNRCKYYDIIISLVDIELNDTIDPILNSSDEILHINLYFYLLENKKLKKILSKDTPYLREFIQKKKPEYLWRYLAAHKQYDESSIVLYNYIDNDRSLTLIKRIKLLKKGIRLSFNNFKLQKDFKTQLKLGEIQLELQERTDDEEDYGFCINGPNDLFYECSTIGYWDLAIRILSFSTYKEEKKLIISTIWANYFVEMLNDLPLIDCTANIIKLFSYLDINSKVAQIEIILPIFENFKINKKGNIYWVFNCLTKVGYHISSLAKMYYNMANDEYIKRETKCEFIDILSYALSKGAMLEKDKVNNMNDWFLENAEDYSDHESVLRNFSVFYSSNS